MLDWTGFTHVMEEAFGFRPNNYQHLLDWIVELKLQQDETGNPARAEQLRQQFMEYHRENPEVWELFEAYSIEEIQNGAARLQSYSIFERIRTTLTGTIGDQYKVNHNFTAFYARLFVHVYPHWKGHYVLRPSVADDIDYSRLIPPGQSLK